MNLFLYFVAFLLHSPCLHAISLSQILTSQLAMKLSSYLPTLHWASSITHPLKLRIISHNIRYATTDPFPNEKPWAERAPRIISQLRHEVELINAPVQTTASHGLGATGTADTAAFICLQEVLHSQLVDILGGLNNITDTKEHRAYGHDARWSYIGVGREDGREAGEYSPILYHRLLFRLLHNSTVWLSPTPHRPSKGWDAGSIRILNVGVFEHIRTGKKLIAANTHLDNAGSTSRLKSVQIILETLKAFQKRWSAPDPLPMFLTGDFNSFPTDEAYLTMKGSGYMTDLHDTFASQHRYGHSSTFTGFEPEKDKAEQGRIDFIWLGPLSANTTAASGRGEQELQYQGKSPWQADGYAVLPNAFDDGIYLSDHRAVVGDLHLQANGRL